MAIIQSNPRHDSQLSGDPTTPSTRKSNPTSPEMIPPNQKGNSQGITTLGPAEQSSEEAGKHSISAGLYVATAILQQGLDFLQDSLTDGSQLVYPSKLLPGSTIGKHLRHARDHFNLLVQCLSQPPPLELSYDIRTRDTPMERSLPAAVSCIQTSIDDLNSILSEDVADGSLEHGGRQPRLSNDTPITLNAVTPFPQTFQTSLGRELWFVALHAIHHYASVRSIAGELGLAVDDTFGVAPSTLRYRNQVDPATSQKAKI